MAIPSQQIGWSQKAKLLWNISKQLEKLTQVAGNVVLTTSTTTTVAPIYTVGELALGGIIAYILEPGDPGYDANVQHGFVLTANDVVEGGTVWGCVGTDIPGADGTAIGTGAQNTVDIVSNCPDAGIAAKLCLDLVESGYNDWYLPSKDELTKVYLNRDIIGGIPNGNYWSSSELNADDAWHVNFLNGDIITNNKVFGFGVRAIRSF
jgi:hypothetical protein